MWGTRTVNTAKPVDPLKALMRERDFVTLKKKLEREWASEASIRLRTLEGLVNCHRHSLAFLRKRVERMERLLRQKYL